MAGKERRQTRQPATKQPHQQKKLLKNQPIAPAFRPKGGKNR